jgi:hypothetical protein
MVTLCFGGRNPELRTLFNEKRVDKHLQDTFKGDILNIDLRNRLMRIVLVPGLIERDLKEQQSIILKLWKELKELYERAEKQALK